jgi:hypothetical protein
MERSWRELMFPGARRKNKNLPQQGVVASETEHTRRSTPQLPNTCPS